MPGARSSFLFLVKFDSRSCLRLVKFESTQALAVKIGEVRSTLPSKAIAHDVPENRWPEWYISSSCSPCDWAARPCPGDHARQILCMYLSTLITLAKEDSQKR